MSGESVRNDPLGVHAQPTPFTEARWLPDEAQLLALIAAVRPKPVADANGDVHCMRLWPVAKCQWVSGHYGGCSTP